MLEDLSSSNQQGPRLDSAPREPECRRRRFELVRLVCSRTGGYWAGAPPGHGEAKKSNHALVTLAPETPAIVSHPVASACFRRGTAWSSGIVVQAYVSKRQSITNFKPTALPIPLRDRSFSISRSSGGSRP